MHRGGTNTNAIATIADVLTAHTGLRFPTTPTALAGCLFTDDAAFTGVFDDAELGRRCVRRVLADVDESLGVNEIELGRALFG